jgi:hypothetical protein
VIDRQVTDSTGTGEVIQEHVTRVKQEARGNDFTPDQDAGCHDDFGCCKDKGCCQDQGCCTDYGCCDKGCVLNENENRGKAVHNRWDIATYVKSDKEPIVSFFEARSIDLDFKQ